MLKLVVQFKDQAGKSQRLSFSDAKPDLEGAVLKAEMDRLVAADMFEKDEQKLYQEVVSGKYVETIETEVF